MTNSSTRVKYNLNEMAKRKAIVVQATLHQLASIKSLLALQSDQIDDLGSDIYELNVDPVLINVPELFTDMNELSVDYLHDSAPVRNIKIESFKNNAKFYAGANTANGYKVISDEFSDTFNMELYKGFSAIERKLRQLVIVNFQYKGRASIAPRRGARKNSPDHIMSQFELGDFFESLLKAPASEAYMKAEWRKSNTKDENEVVRIASLIVLDEIDPGLTFNELDAIRRQRNKCMHFNVVTPTEYKNIVPIMNKYLRRTASLEWGRRFSGITKGLQEYIENILKITAPITMFAKEMTSAHIQQSQGFTQVIKNMLDSQQNES
jgi:hypothetical protein